jgi:hypothetical protein
MYSISAIAHRLVEEAKGDQLHVTGHTAHPIFVVQQRERIYGVDAGYTDDFVWRDEDWDEVDEAESVVTEALYQESGECPRGWHRDGYVDRWVFVQPFFTRGGAEAYIETSRHRLTDPRIYVDSAYRNPEWQAAVKALGSWGKLQQEAVTAWQQVCNMALSKGADKIFSVEVLRRHVAGRLARIREWGSE